MPLVNSNVSRPAGADSLGDLFALGTAQLGMPYGVANRSGQPDAAAAAEIVRAAWQAGVRFFDTAQAYGNSEQVLGQALRAADATATACVVTKLHPQTRFDDPDSVRTAAQGSRVRLGVPALWALFLHHEQSLDQWESLLHQPLRRLVDERSVVHLGVSVYSPDRAFQALETRDLTAVQVAANVFDRRLLRRNFFAQAAEAGRTIFVRSVYLQGLALLSADELPERLAFARQAVTTYQEFCRRHHISPAQFAIDYIRRRTGPRTILVMGVESATQLCQNIEMLSQPPLPDAVMSAWDEAWPDDDALLADPSRWPR